MANGPRAAATTYDIAIRETEPGFLGQPGQIANPASITTNGGLDGNQGVEAALADPIAADTMALRTRWYGMHWEIYARPPTTGGLPVFGHRGATGTLGMAFPHRNTIVIYLTNSGETDVVDEVIDAALEMFGS